MLKSIRTERTEMQNALRLATDALAFYANPRSHQFRRSNAKITPAVTVDGGDHARVTLQSLERYLDDNTKRDLQRYWLTVGE